VELSLNPFQVSVIFWFAIGLLVGLLLTRLGPGRRRLANAQMEIGHHRAEIDARDARIAQLERDVAAARDQVRPLSDEVDRLRRENAKRVAAPAPASVPTASTVDMSGAALAGGAMAPTIPPAASVAPAAPEPLPPFLDAPRGTPDDLTLMKGVGPRLATKLNEIGVFHYRQIAGWSPHEVGIADSKLDTFRGRIERDQLVEQAKLLAAGRTTEYEARFGRLGGNDIPGPV
jgi:predicted flap endonuclease-1-like 5' DNA nuclease